MAIRSFIVILIVAVTGIYARSLASPPAFTVQLPDFASLPRNPGDWTSEDLLVSENVIRVLDSDETLSRVYTDRQGRTVSVFLAYFESQQVNSQIHSPRNCVPGSGWTILSAEQTAEPIIGGNHRATRLIMTRNQARYEMLYWFRTRGGDVTGEFALKWDLVRNALARRPTDAAFIRFMAPVGQEAASRELMTHLSGPLQDALGRAGL